MSSRRTPGHNHGEALGEGWRSDRSCNSITWLWLPGRASLARTTAEDKATPPTNPPYAPRPGRVLINAQRPRCPSLGVERTSCSEALRYAFDPLQKLSRQPANEKQHPQLPSRKLLIRHDRSIACSVGEASVHPIQDQRYYSSLNFSLLAAASSPMLAERDREASRSRRSSRSPLDRPSHSFCRNRQGGSRESTQRAFCLASRRTDF